MSKYNFSQLYKTSVIDVTDPDDKVLFQVTAKQISRGAKASIQKNMLGKISIPENKRAAKQQREKMDLDVTRANDETQVASIESWTLQSDGEDVPVCIEAWLALPSYITEQIEEGIKVLNPELDEEFQD